MLETLKLPSLTTDVQQMLELLATAVDGHIRILDARNGPMCSAGDESRTSCSTSVRPFRIEAEPVGTIEVHADRPVVVAELTAAILNGSYRRRLLVSTYRETLSDSYEQLLKRNQRLEDMADSLETQVIERTRELSETQATLAREEKVAAIGRLAAGVAHELNTPLACVRSNLTALLDEVSSDGEGREILQESMDMTDRAVGIVGDLRGFAHIDDLGCVDVDLNQEIERSLAHLDLPDGVEVEKVFGTLPTVRVDARHLNVALLHLLENARDALPEGGRITLSTSADDELVLIRIRDTGPGIPVETMNRIFDPFFTTKSVGRGTGLGLTVARNIAREFGGNLTLDCSPEGGTVASLSIAVVRPEAKL